MKEEEEREKVGEEGRGGKRWVKEEEEREKVGEGGRRTHEAV